ncbi:MAG: PTS glucose transporter subunit IIA [Oscillospiraceae bacterium]
MLDFLKKKEKKAGEIFATQNGTAVELAEVPDPVFAEKMLGDGIAIIPTDNLILCPVNGTIIDVIDTLHAYCIESDDGLDILVHIGINTVELKGEGFTSLVKVNDKVKVGDKLAIADLEFIKSKGYEIYTPIIITNSDVLKEANHLTGKVEQGKTVVFTYQK